MKRANERDTRYKDVMRNLVRRFITATQKKTESQVITEDDVNEIKQDISAFRCEIVEILKNSGMNTVTTPTDENTARKRKPKMKKLVKGYSVASSFLDPQFEPGSYDKITSASLVDHMIYAPGLTPRKTMFPNYGRSK